MNPRPFAIWSVLVLAVLSLVWMPGTYRAAADDAAATEDVIYMNDGRILHGQILSETPSEIVFQAVIHGMKAQLTLPMEDIVKLERDVPVEAGQEKASEEKTTSTAGSRTRDDSENQSRHRARSDDENAASFYIIPMKGQMGTDVNGQFYKELEDDIRSHNPDYIIIEMECTDTTDDLFAMDDEEEKGLFLVDEYRDMINYFRDDLHDYKQIIWIRDSMGYSSMVALAWPDLFMTPRARLAGLGGFGDDFKSWGDEDIRGKMREATMAFLKSFLEYGGYSPMIVDAMARPEYPLSATWKGREVEWSLDRNGEYVVDNSEQGTVDFTAKSAEDFCISDGTADSLADLALLMGIREYRVLDGKAEADFEKYTEDWRRVYENALQYWEDYQTYRGRGGVQWLGRAKTMLQKIVSAINRYKAVELRLQARGITKFGLETSIEQLEEQLRGMRQGGLGGGTGGGRGGGSGSGGGGGGHGRR